MAVYPLTVFYDGACPICAREMALMKRLDRTQRLTLLDFSLAGFDAAPIGLAVADLSAVIHAQWADGTVITADSMSVRMAPPPGPRLWRWPTTRLQLRFRRLDAET